jgi:hypothetical protein
MDIQATADDAMHMRRSLLQGAAADVDDEAAEFSRASGGSGGGGGGEVEAPFAVLMDLGSARVARMTMRGRLHALEVQEEAARYTSPLYRPPELWDVASDAHIVRARTMAQTGHTQQRGGAGGAHANCVCLGTRGASGAIWYRSEAPRRVGLAG